MFIRPVFPAKERHAPSGRTGSFFFGPEIPERQRHILSASFPDLHNRKRSRLKLRKYTKSIVNSDGKRYNEIRR